MSWSKRATTRWRSCRRCASRWSCSTPIAASAWPTTRSIALFGETAARDRGQADLGDGQRHLGDAGAAPRAARRLRRARAPIVDLEIERVVPGRGLRTLVLNTRAIARAGRPRSAAAGGRRRDRRTCRPKRCGSTPRRCACSTSGRTSSSAFSRTNCGIRWRRCASRWRCCGAPTATPAEAARARQVLDRQVTHMVRIVDDLLDVSRITQGKVELRKEPLELASVVKAAVELCRPAIDAARHTLTVSLPDETVTLNADPVRLTQVLVNLLNNAVKFTPPGGHIWLIAETTGERARRARSGAHPRARHRHRHRAGAAADDLRHVHAGRSLARAHARRTRRRPDARAQSGRAPRRHRRRAQRRARTGSEFMVLLPIDPKAQTGASAGDSHGRGPAVPGRCGSWSPTTTTTAARCSGTCSAAEGHVVAEAVDGPVAIGDGCGVSSGRRRFSTSACPA